LGLKRNAAAAPRRFSFAVERPKTTVRVAGAAWPPDEHERSRQNQRYRRFLRPDWRRWLPGDPERGLTREQIKAQRHDFMVRDRAFETPLGRRLRKEQEEREQIERERLEREHRKEIERETLKSGPGPSGRPHGLWPGFPARSGELQRC